MEVALEHAVACAFPRGGERGAPLDGGLTNTNHQVWTQDGHFVLRCWRDDPGLLAIDRAAEHANSVRAARAGVGAEVLAFLPECNAMVLAFVEGPTFSAADLRRGDRLEEVAAACRRLHAAERFDGDFDMFAVQARYREVVRERGFRLPDRYDAFSGHVARVRDALAANPLPTVPCHNDLLAENLIDAPGGVMLIDYEYGGNNDPLFELGNLWAESGLSLPQLEALVAAYHGSAPLPLVARARLWALMAQHGWTLWAAIQAGSSPLEFDFWGWGMEKHERAVAGFEAPEFDALLADARRTV